MEHIPLLVVSDVFAGYHEGAPAPSQVQRFNESELVVMQLRLRTYDLMYRSEIVYELICAVNMLLSENLDESLITSGLPWSQRKSVGVALILSQFKKNILDTTLHPQVGLTVSNPYPG
jgi:hypothetical protein